MRSKHRARGKEDIKEFLEAPFRFPTRMPDKCKKPDQVSANLDSVDNLILAHETIDAELLKWASGVEKGFEDRETGEARECEKIEQLARTSLARVKELKEMTAKMRRKHERITEEADNDEQLVR